MNTRIAIHPDSVIQGGFPQQKIRFKIFRTNRKTQEYPQWQYESLSMMVCLKKASYGYRVKIHLRFREAISSGHP